MTLYASMYVILMNTGDGVDGSVMTSDGFVADDNR